MAAQQAALLGDAGAGEALWRVIVGGRLQCGRRKESDRQEQRAHEDHPCFPGTIRLAAAAASK